MQEKLPFYKETIQTEHKNTKFRIVKQYTKLFKHWIVNKHNANLNELYHMKRST